MRSDDNPGSAVVIVRGQVFGAMNGWAGRRKFFTRHAALAYDLLLRGRPPPTPRALRP